MAQDDMSYEENIYNLKKMFAKRYPHAELIIHTRKIKGKMFIYFKTTGAYKVDTHRLIEYFFNNIELMSSDYNTLTYKYRGKL